MLSLRPSEGPRRDAPQPSSDTGTNSHRSSGPVETVEHKRFVEFCDACRRYRYVGLCYGSAGVGKTLSARLYADWDKVEASRPMSHPSATLLMEVSQGQTTFYSCPVVASPNQIELDISRSRQ